MRRMLGKIKNNIIVTIIYQIIMRFVFNVFNIMRHITGGGRYRYLKKYKDIHKGQRCFIICTGPSLTYEDLDLLKNEITFGMNSLCLGYKENDFRPTYYGIQDIRVYKLFENELKNENNIPVFTSSYMKRKCKNLNPNWNVLPFNGIYNSFEMVNFNKLKVKFGTDISCMVYEGYTITYTLFQLAAYMGFSEIYLIGADCNYVTGKKNHIIDYGQTETDNFLMKARERMLFSYSYANKKLEKIGVHIYNATRGGMLDVFPRVNLEDVLNEKNVS